MTRSLLAVALAMTLGPPAAAQVPVSAPPAQQPPFRATTLVVEADAIVTDGQRRFVADLSADDFEILEDGKPQAIQRIYLVRGREAPAMRPTTRTVPVPAAPPAAFPPVPASAPQQVHILFFDQDHLDEASFQRLRAAAEEFLKTRFEPGDIGGVLIGGTMANKRLTGDRDELVAAVRSVKLSSDQTSRRLDLRDWPRMTEVEAIRIAINADPTVLRQVADRAAREAVDRTALEIREKPRPAPDFEPTVREKAQLTVARMREAAIRTITTLQALLNGLARVPGRKTVVFMTEGFFVEESWIQLRLIVGQAARSNVRLYSIDALGMRRRDPGTSVDQATPLETGGSIPLDAFNTIEEGPNTLAVDTGGYVIRNTNDFSGALAEIALDTSQYYVISYSPTNAALDGSFRQITVRVKRPGLSVRARRGYVATPLAAPPEPASPGGADTAPPSPMAPPSGAPVPSPPAPALPTASPVPAPSAPAPPAPLATSPLVLRPDVNERVRDLASRTGESSRGKELASKGWDRYSKGDLEGAARLLSEAAAEPDSAPWVFYALGWAQLGLKQPERAAESWERVRAAVPAFSAVYLDLTDAYLQADDPGRAIDVLRAGEHRWPKDTEILNALGTVQVRRGSLDDALDSFRRATEARPDESLAYFNLARTHELRYYRMRRFSQREARWVANPADLRNAIENYQRYLKLGGPYEDQARLALGRLEWVK